MIYKNSLGTTISYIIILTVIAFLGIITLYPFIYTISMSVSDPVAVMRNQVSLLPIGFHLDSYFKIITDNRVWQAYYNTLWYTLVGTSLNLVLTIMGGYALSRRGFRAGRFMMVMITIPMFFGGGMVPNFVLINTLGLYNTRWAIVLPGAVSSWNLIITRTFFHSTIPDSIPEAAKIEGANDIQIFTRVIIPISGAIIALITLFAAVSFWNLYFPAILYTYDIKFHPMTVFLRNIILMGGGDWGDSSEVAIMNSIQFKYTSIIISILPIICIYPFLQKYFIKGIMIGSIKE